MVKRREQGERGPDRDGLVPSWCKQQAADSHPCWYGFIRSFLDIAPLQESAIAVRRWKNRRRPCRSMGMRLCSNYFVAEIINLTNTLPSFSFLLCIHLIDQGGFSIDMNESITCPAVDILCFLIFLAPLDRDCIVIR